MTEEQAKFLTLFMGIEKPYEWYLKFEVVQSFMEEKWPEMWEDYLRNCFHNVDYRGFTRYFNEALNLSNLISFLLQKENVEKWGWMEYPKTGHITGVPLKIIGGKTMYRHPALAFARESGMV